MKIVSYTVFGQTRNVNWNVCPKLDFFNNNEVKYGSVTNWIDRYFESRGLLRHLTSYTTAKPTKPEVHKDPTIEQIYGVE